LITVINIDKNGKKYQNNQYICLCNIQKNNNYHTMLSKEEQKIVRKAFIRLSQAIEIFVKKASENNMLNAYGKPFKNEYVRQVAIGNKDDLALEILILEVCKTKIEEIGLLQKQKQKITNELKDVPLIVNNHKSLKANETK